jgi:GNAT superfamily N-acetyltransferase
MARLVAAQQSEMFPDEPPQPVADVIAGHRAVPARVRWWQFQVRDSEGAFLGHAFCQIDPEHDDTPDLLEVMVFVDPTRRRRGAGSALFEQVLELARREHRTRITSWTTSRAPGSAEFARAMGASAVSEGHINSLRLDDVDRALLEQWVKEGPQRAPGYELLAWDGPVPDEHIGAFADLYNVMNEAPLDDLVMNDYRFTPESLREWEQRAAAASTEAWTVVARAPDGTLAGFHGVNWMPSQPTIMNVADTGVRKEHRGHALGKWLKAVVTLRALDERPSVKEIRTGNADSNEAMLGINHAMGYRSLFSTTTWELTVD